MLKQSQDLGAVGSLFIDLQLKSHHVPKITLMSAIENTNLPEGHQSWNLGVIAFSYHTFSDQTLRNVVNNPALARGEFGILCVEGGKKGLSIIG